MTTFYHDDDEAREDWDAERAAFQRPADAEDQLDLPIPMPTRFYIDEAAGLPVVRDRLNDSMIVGRFITLGAARHYLDLREVGVGHQLAMMANPETREKFEREETA